MCKICRLFPPDNKLRAVYHNVSSLSVANMIVGAFFLVCLCWARIIDGSSNMHAQSSSKSLTNIFIAWKTFESFNDALVVR